MECNNRHTRRKDSATSTIHLASSEYQRLNHKSSATEEQGYNRLLIVLVNVFFVALGWLFSSGDSTTNIALGAYTMFTFILVIHYLSGLEDF